MSTAFHTAHSPASSAASASPKALLPSPASAAKSALGVRAVSDEEARRLRTARTIVLNTGDIQVGGVWRRRRRGARGAAVAQCSGGRDRSVTF
jgi:hypothetical protein